MTIPFRNHGHFLVGFRVGSRRPPQPEMVLVVRALYDIGDDGALTLRASDEVTAEQVEQARALDERAGEVSEKARMCLGQGTLLPETYRDDDEQMVGELVYPGDFAMQKRNAEVVVRGSCHADREATEAEVEVAVGSWKKALKVVGTRVRTDEVAGGHATKPQPVGVMAVDYAHAYGGPAFPANRVGKGYVAPPEPDAGAPAEEGDEEVYQPPRSQRSQVMVSQQLPNVLYADGAELKKGLPAGFGPLPSSHPHRAQFLGKKYGPEWLQKRAPFMAEDYDARYEHSAPPDQQLKGYLRGDEEVSFKNFHAHRRRLTTTLPRVRVRTFVIDDRDDVREAKMQLDTLFADLDDDALYLTWRGHTPVREEDLSDVRFGLCAVEPLDEAPRPAAHYEAELRAFAADPYDMDNAFPADFEDMAERAERLESASDEDLERMADRCMESSDPGGPVGAAMRMLFGAKLDDMPEETLVQLKAAHEHMDEAEVRAKVLETLQVTPPAAGSIDLDEGTMSYPLGGTMKQVEAQFAAAEQPEAGPEYAEKLAEGKARLDAIDIQAIDPSYDPSSGAGEDEPGPGANLAGRDLSGMDLRGVDLTGADLRSAILSRSNLEGCRLVEARLEGAQLFRACLDGADLSRANLSSATLKRVGAKGARFDGAKLDMTRIERSDLSGASLEGSAGRMAMVTQSNLDGASARGLIVQRTIFDGCSLEKTDLSGAQFSFSAFKHCKGKGLVLDGAALDNSAFHECEVPGLTARGVTGKLSVWMKTKLEGADFGKASLPAAHFMMVEAADATFRSANLPEARFDRAVLKRCCFDGAKLSHANLRSAVLSKATFVKASLYDAKLMQSFGEDVDLGGANLERTNLHRSRITRR